MARHETEEAKAIRIGKELARRELLLAGTMEQEPEPVYKQKKKHERVRPNRGGKLNGGFFNGNTNGNTGGHQHGFGTPRSNFPTNNSRNVQQAANPPFATRFQPAGQVPVLHHAQQKVHPQAFRGPINHNSKIHNALVIPYHGFGTNDNGLQNADRLGGSRWAAHAGGIDSGIPSEPKKVTATMLQHEPRINTLMDTSEKKADASIQAIDEDEKASDAIHKAEVEENQAEAVSHEAAEIEVAVELVAALRSSKEDESRAVFEQKLDDVPSECDDPELRVDTSEHQLKVLEIRCSNVEQAYSTAQEEVRTLVARIQKLESDNKALDTSNIDFNRRLVAFQNMAKFDQNQLKESDEKARKLETNLLTTQELLQNAERRYMDNMGATRERDGLRRELDQAKGDSKYYQNQVDAMTIAVRKANSSHEGCDGKIEALKAKVKRVAEYLEIEQAAHEEVKTRLANAHAREAGVESRLAACQADLQSNQYQAKKISNSARDYKILAEKQKLEIQMLKDELKKEKGNNDFANLLSAKPPKKKSKMQRNRKFDPEIQARMLKQESKRLEMKETAISNALVLYRPYHSWFYAPESSHNPVVASLVVFGPLPAIPGASHSGGKFIGGSLVKMEMDNPVYHDINRIRCITDRTRSTSEEYLHLAEVVEALNSNFAPKEKCGDSKWDRFGVSKPAKRVGTIFLGLTLAILSIYLSSGLDPLYKNFNKMKYVSAAPSCEVFGSALSVVETTYPWEPPRPSAIAFFASSALSAPQPSASQLFWIDTGYLMGNCSSSDRAGHEQTVDDDTCDISREVNERRIAIGITVTVVIPTVVVSALAFSFGWI
ncbi:hypothetical protein BKA65DRAFT_477279 [Rhexocercosporidium sp. MPI-PUGE-AT-0058]|nr:hypothetical protein BKA65DRAFT_477279 [Rhexocercosporidium sp. MPI-PUGE-AT-0058]